MHKMTTDTGAQSSRNPSYWKVGGALLGLVVVVLAGAFLLNQKLQPQVDVAPAATVVRTITPHPASSEHHAQTPRATIQPAIAVTSSAKISPTVRPSPTPTPRRALMQAYHRYWQSYSQALYTLDTSHMSGVAVGAELRRVQAEVAGFRQRNRAVHVRATHSALIVSVKGDSAIVYDEIHNRSFTIDPVTKQPPQGSNQVDIEKDIYYFKRISGTWKVTKSLREG